MFKSRYNEENVQEIILNIFNSHGSDLHFSPNNHIGYRIDGKLIKQNDKEKLTPKDTKSIYNAILNMLEPDYKELVERYMIEKKHAGFSLSVSGKRLRVNASKAGNGFYIVLRALEDRPKELNSLGFSDKVTQSLRTISGKNAGLFLVVGPTGSGKSTTLASLIYEINKAQQKNIITLEDPIEYIHEEIRCNVVQKEIGADLLSFYEGLHSALREDPDILLVGEIRDERTLNLALKAAETGHLVFSTLHTDNTVSTIQRIVAMTDNPNLTRDRLATTLLGVLAQRLEPIQPLSKEEAAMRKLKERPGRLIIYEMLHFNNSLRNMIKENNDVQIKGIIDNTLGSQSYDETLSNYVFDRILESTEALRMTSNKKELQVKLNKKHN